MSRLIPLPIATESTLSEQADGLFSTASALISGFALLLTFAIAF